MADSKNTLKEDDGDNGEPLVIVEDESKLTATDPNLNEDDEDDEDGDDRKIRNSDEDDVDPDNPDSDRAALQESRRRERQERKKRRRESVQRDRIELDFLRKQNEELERRLAGVEQRTHRQDLGAMDAQIAKALQEVEMADKVIAKAVAAGNGDDVAQALKYRDQARERAQQLNFAKQQAAQAAAPAPDAAGGLDRRAIAHAQKFLNENAWYDPQGGDEQSAIVLAIDASLVRDGYDPKTEEYWDELRDRAARRLPERFGGDAAGKKDDASARKPRGGPAVSSGREHAPATTRREVYISPERKQALIEAGVWDDPVLRDKYVRRYAEYDRNKRQ